MEYRVLGRTGVSVSTFCLGTMMFGRWGNPDVDECVAMVDSALDAGVNFIDTADVYDFGTSEEIVGRALRGRRDQVVLATKFHNPMGEDPNSRGNSRRWILRAVEESLRRLGTDWIDLYQVHRPDPATDLDETLGALSDLVRAGKVRLIGTSTFPPDLLVEAQWVSERRGRERFVTEQPPYSILARGIESGVLPVCERYGLGALVYSPLNGGWLTGKYRSPEPPAGSRAAREPDHFDFGGAAHRSKTAAVEALAGLAQQAGLSLIELSLAWVLHHPAVDAVIIGPRTPDQLRDQLRGAGRSLDAGVLDRIDEIVPPGSNLSPADAGWTDPALSPTRRRR
ncbi:MAG: aldo/keto reductase [Acidobacteriota bacterium]|nr:aldo/keto reductase [Acidobacteriota bacterium]